VSETRVGKWKRQFLEAGAVGVEAGGKAGPNATERALLDEVEDLKGALGEAHVELRRRPRMIQAGCRSRLR
jgi:transposase